MTPLGWSGWDHDRVMLSTVRLTWCMMDTADGAGRQVRGQGSGAAMRGHIRILAQLLEVSRQSWDQREEGIWLRPHSLPRGLSGASRTCSGPWVLHLQISDIDNSGHSWGARATPSQRRMHWALLWPGPKQLDERYSLPLGA